MLCSEKTLRKYTVRARDGDLGKVDELYFDDETWAMRFAVVNTGAWKGQKSLLVSAQALGCSDRTERTLYIDLTREQVYEAADLYSSVKPVFRQWESKLQERFQGKTAWFTILSAGAMRPRELARWAEREQGTTLDTAELDDPTLRSTREVARYSIRAWDGKAGSVKGFVIDDANWSVRYLVVNTRRWWPNQDVLIAPSWIEGIDWQKAQVRVGLRQRELAVSPLFESTDAE